MLIDEMAIFRLEITGDSNIIYFLKKSCDSYNLMEY
jgi:hypothetical protein